MPLRVGLGGRQLTDARSAQLNSVVAAFVEGGSDDVAGLVALAELEVLAADFHSAYNLLVYALEKRAGDEPALLLLAHVLAQLGDGASAAALLSAYDGNSQRRHHPRLDSDGTPNTSMPPPMPLSSAVPQLSSKLRVDTGAVPAPLQGTQHGDDDRVWRVDVFPFNGERMCELHLHLTAHLFDRVYIVEAWQPFATTAPRKAQLYSRQPYWQRVFSQYGDKVVVVEVTDLPPTPLSWVYFMKTRVSALFVKDPSSWWREAVVRSAPLATIAKDLAGRRYVLFVTDADEIVRPSVLAELAKPDGARQWYNYINSNGGHPGVVYLLLTMLVYNWQWASPTTWFHAFAITDRTANALLASHGHLATLDGLRKYAIGPSGAANPLSAWGPAGYHLTYFMTVEEIAQKLTRFAHTEASADKFVARTWIERCIAEGHDILGKCSIGVGGEEGGRVGTVSGTRGSVLRQPNRVRTKALSAVLSDTVVLRRSS